jgi:hypothetical protein
MGLSIKAVMYGAPFAQKLICDPNMRCDVRHVIVTKSRVEVTHKLVPEENSLCVRQLKGVTYI